MGYEVREDHTPGTWNGQAYDLVQRDIRYNHVALLPPGSGRAGRECALRLDSTAAVLDDEQTPRAAQERIDEAIAPQRARFYKAEARADAAEAKIAELTAKVAEFESRAALRARVAPADVLGSKPVTREDGAPDAEAARRAMVERNANAWRYR
jgi:uncharacterized protein